MKTKTLTLKSNKQIALVYRSQSTDAVKMAKKVAERLISKKYKVYTAPEQSLIPKTEALVSSQDLKKMSLIIVLGGDGTYLRAARLLKGNAVPILGFNMGSLGFLTSHSIEEVFELIELTLKNKMVVEQRNCIHAVVETKAGKKVYFDALNDLVIERGSSSQLINTSIHYDKAFVNTIKADGLVVATPTGSTAYNLAAGGPILHPQMDAIIVSAVAPHSLTTRPLVFPDGRKLTLKIEKPTPTAHLVIDGQKVLDLTSEDVVTIEKSDKKHLMVQKPNHNFYTLLKDKFKFGDRYASGN